MGQRFIGIALLGGATYIFCGTIGLEGWHLYAPPVIAMLGYFGGRVADGVRGTHWQKSLRGLLYSTIPIGFALVLWSPVPLFGILWSPLNGFIAWACSKLPVADSTMYAEPIAGLFLGMINLGALEFIQ